MKYQNYFQENSFIRGSLVLSEGKEMTHLHLVMEGEFELSRNIQYMNNKDLDQKAMLK